MSLFKAREFWTTACEGDEAFGSQCLLVSKLNADFDFVITGSYAGVLRIFRPSCDPSEGNVIRDYKASDLLLEKLFEGPILQLKCGKLVSGTSDVQLAVLQTRCIGVYSLICKEGATEHGNQYNLQLMYEHKLRRNSANFVLGAFGGSQNRDFCCVQSLDGMLTFFEQEIFGFCCFLPDFLLPGPLVYLPRSDVFVTSSSDWRIVAYGYKYLSEIGENSKLEDTSGRKLTETWVRNLGEAIIDCRVTEVGNKEHLIVLGERNFYGLDSNGILKFMKRIEYSPLCFTTYNLGEENQTMIIIVSETNTLLLYQNTTLKWSARLPFAPVAISRACLKHLKGIIVTSSGDGQLHCSYLGTEPSVFVAPPLSNQSMNFEKANEELAKLTDVIKTSSKASNLKEGNEIVVITEIKELRDDQSKKDGGLCIVGVELIPQENIEDVHLAISLAEPFIVKPRSNFYQLLNEKSRFASSVFIDKELCPSSSNIEVVVTYINNAGIPKVVVKKTRLPFDLIAEVCQSQKESEFKIIFNINQTPLPLSALFPEFQNEDATSASAHSVAFRNKHQDDSEPVTILLAKSSERYRIQCNSLLPLNFVVEEVIYRVTQKFLNSPNFKINFTSPLPIVKVLEYVNEHFQVRQTVVELERSLTQLGTQYRLIQKRLISKFKVKNPTPLKNLQLIIQDTYKDIIEKTDLLERETYNLHVAQTNLASVLNLTVNLIRLMDIKKEILPYCEATFVPKIYDSEGISWEDFLDASLCFLLRTTLARSEKDKLRAPHTSFEEIKEIAKVEKHLTQVLERISKSERILETNFPEAPEQVENEEAEEGSTGKEILPIGSQIGQSSSRILSARKSLLRKRQKLNLDS